METTTGITVDQLRDLFYGLITPKSGNITIWIDPCAAAEKAAPWDVFIELHNVFGPHASQRQPDASLWYALPVYKSRYHEAVRAIKQALRGVKKMTKAQKIQDMKFLVGLARKAVAQDPDSKKVNWEARRAEKELVRYCGRVEATRLMDVARRKADEKQTQKDQNIGIYYAYVFVSEGNSGNTWGKLPDMRGRTPKEAFSKSIQGNLIKIKKDETWERHGLGQTIYALRRVGAKRWNYYAEVAE